MHARLAKISQPRLENEIQDGGLHNNDLATIQDGGIQNGVIHMEI